MEIPETHKGKDGGGRVYKDFLLPILSSSSTVSTPNDGTSTNAESGNNSGNTNNEQTFLKCLLISDPTSDKFAAAMTIAVGQMHDPEDGHGIAHLTEHMLFMGSKLYESENEYDTFLSKNAGYHNAYTDLEMTNYYFECSNKAADGALDRFAAGFASPLLRSSTVEREVNAIDSEHAKNRQQDTWRIHQLSRTIIGKYFTNVLTEATRDGTKPEPIGSDVHVRPHSYGSFGTGNKATLLECTIGPLQQEETSVIGNTPTPAAAATTTTTTTTTTTGNSTSGDVEGDVKLKEEQVNELQRKVQTFYENYYTAENMAIAIMGNQSIDELVTFVKKYFSNLPTRALMNSKKTTTGSSTTLNSSIPEVIPALLSLVSTTTTTTTTTTSESDGNEKIVVEKHKLPAVVEVVPIKKESQSVEIQWIVSEQQTLYRSKPLRYYSHLLGHEGPGSLLVALRQLQYAQELYADDGSKSTSTFCIFTVNIELTELGLQNINTVISMTLYYIQYIITQNIPEWVFDELYVTGETQFRFLSKQGASDTVCSLASHMHQYPSQHYISGPYKIFDHPYNPETVRTAVWPYLSTTKNMLVIVSSIQFQDTTDQVDPYYNTNYRIIDHHNDIETKYGSIITDPKTILDDSITAMLKLPEKNDMLPSNFDLIQLSEHDPVFTISTETTTPPSWLLPPRCLVNTDVCRLWYKPDTASFNTPKVNFLAILRTPNCAGSPAESVLASLYTEIITEVCNEFAYAASMAGLHCGFIPSKQSGIEIQVSGYNHKVDILLNRICDAIQNQIPIQLAKNPELFYRVRDKIEESLAAVLVGQPYQYSSYVADLCLEVGTVWTIHDRLEYVQEVTIDDFTTYIRNLFTRFHLEVLIHGNVSSTVAMEYTNIVLDAFKPKPVLHTITNRVVQLPAGIECVYKFPGFNEENDNSCILNLYQVGTTTNNNRMIATLSMLNQLIREPAFNQLRTEEQLGYIIFTSVKTNGDDVKSLLVLIQSDSYDPVYMNERIESFLIQFRTKIMQLSPEEYQSNVHAVIESLVEKNKNLTEESSKHWQVISNRSYRFVRQLQIAEIVKDITQQEVLQVFDKYIAKESLSRRKLSIQIYGKKHPMNDPTISTPVVATVTTGDDISINQTNNSIVQCIIEEPTEFVRTQPLYSTPPSVPMDGFMLMTPTTSTTKTTSK